MKIFWIVVLFAVWQWVPMSALFPRPLGTWNEFVRLYNNGILVDAWVSTWTIIRAAFFIALPLGLILSYLYTIEFFRPPIALLANYRNVSMTALVAAFIMMRMGGDQLKVYTMAFVILVYFLSSRLFAFMNQSRDELDHAVSMRMSPWQTLWHRIVRGKLHLALLDFVPCIGMGWAMLSFVEGTARDNGGLGDVMLQVDKINSYDGILALAIISVVIGGTITTVLRGGIRGYFRYATQVAIQG